MTDLGDDPNFLASERAIAEYASALERFASDPNVAERLANIQRNLLFRSRAFAPGTVSLLLDRSAKLADLHPGHTALQESVRDTTVVALSAIAKERLAEALGRYSQLRALMDGAGGPQSGDRGNLAMAFDYLHSELANRYPAVALSFWSDLSTFAKDAPPDEKWAVWIPMATRVAMGLAEKDPLAAYSTWVQAVAWGRPGGFHAESAVNLVQAASEIISSVPDQGREINESLWSFIKNADVSRQGEHGLESRLVSVVAAFKMMRFLSASMRASLTERLKTIGEAPAAEPERAAVLEEHDRPLANIRASAEGWISEDLVSHRGWNRFLSVVQHDRPMLFSRLYRGFVQSLTELSVKARTRYAAAARAEIKLAEASPPWVDRPLVPITWEDVTDPELIRDVMSHLVTPRAPLEGKADRIQRLRAARPSFYRNTVFYEVQVDRGQEPPGIAFFALLENALPALFDGGSGQLHEINGGASVKGEGFLVRMDEPAVALEYTLFFSGAVWGDEGPFRIVRSLDEIPFREPPAPEVEKRIAEIIIADPKPYKDIDDWRIAATVLYGRALFKATFELKTDGQIRMIDDDIVLNDLPVRTLTRSGPLRTVEGLLSS